MFSRDNVVLAMSLLGVAAIVARLTYARLGILAVALGALVFVFLVVAVRTLLRQIKRQRDIELERVSHGPIRVSPEDAEAKARMLLLDSGRFVTTTAVRPLETNLPVTPRVRKLLDGFESIRTAFGDYEIARGHLAPSKIKDGHLRIGVGPGEIEIATLDGDERVFELEQGEEDDNPAEDVYFYLLEVDRGIHG